jgi:hypothetical protein
MGKGKHMSITAMKQLIEDLISAMEYHVEQTRPIHMTTVAIQAAKDALKAMDTTPQPQGEWVGLTDEERVLLQYKSSGGIRSPEEMCFAVEAKLKEKNT